MIARALAAACADPDVLARVGGPLGRDARAASDALAREAPAVRRNARAAWAAAARAPVPPGLRGVHASWIEAALSELPARAREAVAAATDDALAIWLARWACAAIPPMPPIDVALRVPRGTAEVVALAPHVLESWLLDVGADQLALALGAQAEPAVAVFGERLRVAAARVMLPPRIGELGARRKAIERARVEPEPIALLVIGARAIAPHLDPLAARQLVHRFDRVRGVVLARELRVHARDPVAEAPSWHALGASAIT